MKNTALITGASSGIGLELATKFASEGKNLLLVARREDNLQNLAKDLIAKFKIQAHVYAIDLGEQNSSIKLYDYCVSHSIEISYLINNAGFGDFGFFAESDWNKQAEMINLNILTLTQLTHLFLPKMIERKFGKILNVASIAAFMPGPKMSNYFASKAFVLSFSEGLSNELSGTGVTVTALCPGPTDSGFMTRASMEDSGIMKGKKLPSSEIVANYGYNALMKGKVVAIHGLSNKIMIFSLRFTPRSLVRVMVRYIQDKV